MTSQRSIQAGLALALFAATAIGCQYDTPNRELHVSSHDRFTPSGRISYEIHPGIETRRRGTLLDLVTDPPKEEAVEEAVTARSTGVRGTISIEGEVAAVDGRDHRQLAAGDQVEMDGVVISGPARISVKAENLRGYVAARGGVRVFDVLSVEGITGIAVDKTEVRLRGAGVGAKDDDVDPGLLMGFRTTLRPIALFDVYYQLTFNIHDWTDDPIEDSQVGLELNLTRNVSVFGGYRWWSYEKHHSEASDIDLRLRGPTAGLSLKF